VSTLPDSRLDVSGSDTAIALVDADQLRVCLTQLLVDGCPAGLSLAIVSSKGLIVEAHGGFACLVGEPVPVTPTTCYDLASLTKVVCSASLALMARQAGHLGFEDPVRTWLADFPRSDTTVLHLLTHTSGIVDHVPFFETLEGRPAIESAVYEWAAKGTPEGIVRYSDLNFMLLGWVLEACFGQGLDAAFQEHLAEPLGLASSLFSPPPSWRTRTAATELDGDQRRRAELVWGSVHDGNAFALGGVAGHAGLFSSLRDLSHFVRFLLGSDPEGVLSDDSRQLMRTKLAATDTDVRGIGWRLDPVSWGTWPANTLWHTGFTGTSLLVCSDLDLGVVLLTNAIHPHRQLEAQQRMRVTVHQLIRSGYGRSRA
jgi:serine-type D-Ala-D-Ala carboxypeptidase